MTDITISKLREWSRRPDPVLLAVAVLLLGLAIFLPKQAVESLGFASSSLLDIAPYLAASVAIAAYAKASGADAIIAEAFQGRVWSMILLAALIGGLSPFCSCGVIPLIAALLSIGVPLAPVMAFWLSSPVIDPSMFVLTVGALGMDFALAKTLAAVGAGLFGGLVVQLLAQGGHLGDQLKPRASGCGGCGSPLARGRRAHWAFWREAGRRQSFVLASADSAYFLGKWLFLAFLLESLMLAYVPGDLIASLLGGEGLAPVALATFVGVPAYLNGYAALPLVSGLIEQGMQPGAGLAFLVAGGITSIPAAMAVFALVKARLFLLYLGLALAASFASGLAYNLVA